MAIGRRCSLCAVTWPDDVLFMACPDCKEATYRCGNVEPIPEEEARRVLLFKCFDEYYERRCERRGVPADGPLLVIA
jgi:hypothetical protein